MNVLYVIGNGFDMSFDLPTSYGGYYEYLRELKDNGSNALNENVLGLIDNIEENKNNWSDLELELGRYIRRFTMPEEIEDIHSFLVHSLSEYLIKIEENYNCDDSQKAKICEDLLYPENYLLNTDKIKVKKFRTIWTGASANWSLNILTLNYTSIFERVIGYKNARINCGKYNDRNALMLNSINHIHGYKDQGLALGLNDVSQFDNGHFVEDEDIQNLYIKSKYNVDCKTGHEAVCLKHINEANLICSFGVSFGNTDNRWWKHIGSQLKKTTTRLIIFHYEKGFVPDPIYPLKRSRLERKVIEIFLSHLSLSDAEKTELKARIFVSINSSMFKIDNSKFIFNDFVKRSEAENC